MDALRRILVASDLTPRGHEAVARAVLLAQAHGAELTALHVVEQVLSRDGRLNWLTALSTPPGRPERQVLEEGESLLRDEIASLKGTSPLRFAVLAKLGDASVEIIRSARDDEADMVVIGARGRHPIRDFFLGTTAARIVREGDRPVLVVKRAAAKAYQRVVVAVDFSDHARHALLLAARLAPQAQIIAVHAFEIAFEARLLGGGGLSEMDILNVHREYREAADKEMGALLAQTELEGRQIRSMVVEGYAGEVVPKAASRQRADLLAVGTRGAGGSRFVRLGGVAERVLHDARMDVLAVHAGPTSRDSP